MTDLAEIEAAVTAHGLSVLGGLPLGPDDNLGPAQTLLLLGPAAGSFWPIFASSPEAQDGAADPMDRWSARVVGTLAEGLGASPVFPFGGPPHHPFYSWALRTGQVHVSPVNLLVDGRTGLWVSFRGALGFAEVMPLPQPSASPCNTCPERPCTTACPVGALGTGGYDVPACKDFLHSDSGIGCMSQGCAVRAACPVSVGSDRESAQSAFHMTAFIGP